MLIEVKNAFIENKLHSNVTIETKTRTIVGPSNKPDIDFFVPAFIDIHCHGGGGKYVWEDFSTVENIHHENGTSLQFASLITMEFTALLKTITSLVARNEVNAIHLEGPYLSTEYCGAHEPSLLRLPSMEEIKELIAAGNGKIKMITIAPELPNALEVISYLKLNGVIPAIGHSAAGQQATKAAISAGAQVVTHLNNGMKKLGAEDAMSQAALNSDIYLEVIPDLQHLDLETLKFIINKKPNRVIAISDAMCAAGCGDGKFKIGNLPVVVEDGIARLESNGKLAGSTLTMLDAFLNLSRNFGTEVAVELTSRNAKVLLNQNDLDDYIAITGRKVTYF